MRLACSATIMRSTVAKRCLPYGFTLMEIGVALVLAALMVAVAIPAVQSVTATQLRRSATQISGMTREAYARAAITGKPHRLVLDLEANTFWLEQASGYFVLHGEKAKQLSEAELTTAGPEKKTGLASFIRSEADLDEGERLKVQLARGPEWSAAGDELGIPHRLPAECAFEKVWVAHQVEAFTRGQSHLYFWPSGQTESAVIRLTDDPESNGRIISVKVNGLTGRSAVVAGAAEVPR
jgi:type II secretory pathway pseudopilin PulG